MVVNPESRWGYNEVLRWYKGEDVPVVDNSPILYYKQFLFDAEKKLIANNVRELADLMKTDKAAAIRFLYSGKITKWLEDSGNEKLALEINDVVENIFPLNQQAGLAGCIYVMNPEQPFLFDSPYPSSTPAEIVKAFSHNENTEDEYKALTDGRLLLWLSTKNEPSLYEQIEELTKQKDYSIGLAYGVLYHLDKKCGFDLKEYTGRKQVGEIMNEALVKAQDIADEDQYKAHLHDFLGDKGRLYYYALTHKWDDVLKYMELCLDYNSKSGEQYGEHNYFIASYKFCTGLGYKPGYYLSRTEKTIYSQEELAKLSDKDISNEMRNGKLKYWLTVFYHEDPFRDFSEEYSFEKTLESYLNYVSKYNKADYYSKRFINAKESIEEQIKQFNGVFNKAIRLDLVSFLITAALSVFLLYLLQTHGISNKELFVKNYFVTVGVPILLFGLVYWGIKVYFLSMGVILSILSTIGGGILTLIPAIGAYWILADSPELSVPVASALVVVYLAIFFFSLCRKSTLKIRKLKRIGKRTIQSSLLDPLYFTYMVNASKYKSDTSIAITDGIEIIQDVRRKLSTHYVLWILLLACFVILFICISPDFLGIEVPEITWENIKVFFRLRND
ncbi:hypothetical protein LJC72_09100, partial [Bacteroides sp. OttesenSCG-928-D19]|nr:hypothetical protein [Bacteroides sp. OttesenSCG-928-D19]